MIFFDKIGESYIVRRIFRQWLSDKINMNINEIENLLDFNNNDKISNIWSDEIIISILNSQYCYNFLTQSSHILFRDNLKLFKRFMFLLQLACKEYHKTITYNGIEYPIYVPIGNGWEGMIEFIFSYISEKEVQKLPHLTDVIYDWTINRKSINAATIKAAKIALVLLSSSEKEKKTRLTNENKQKLIQILCHSSAGIRSELNEIIEQIVDNNWLKYRDPYYDFSKFILTEPTLSKDLIYSIPEGVRKLAKTFWTVEAQHNFNEKWEDHNFHNYGDFGLRQIGIFDDYDPAGAKQTPIYELLVCDLWPTLSFVVDFVNDSIVYYNQHHKTLSSINIDLPNGKSRKLLGADYIWELYRGASSVLTPPLLQSIHMAIEKFLLDLMNHARQEVVEEILNFIFSKAISVSLIAIVSSIVIAYPEILWKYALHLFKTIDFFHYDRMRVFNENRYTESLGYAVYRNKEEIAQERIVASKMSFRNESLESICTKYQYFGITRFTEKDNTILIDTIYKILDIHYKSFTIDSVINETSLILLHRIDRRKHIPSIIDGQKEHEFIIELNPQLPDNLKQKSIEAERNVKRSFQFSPLYIWSFKRFRKENTNNLYGFDSNPNLVVSLIKELLHAISNGEFLTSLEATAHYCAAGILIRDFSESLECEDLLFCANLVEQRIQLGLHSDYFPQFSDGLEICIHALPMLIKIYPNKTKLIQNYLLGFLNIQKSVGSYKRVCDYAIETIHEENFWGIYHELTSEIFDRFNESIFIQKNTILNKYKEGLKIEGHSMFSKIPDPENIFLYKNHQSPNDNHHNVLRQDVRTVEKYEILLELTPCWSNDFKYIEIIKNSIVPIICESLRDSHSYHNQYHRHLYLYHAFANFVINQRVEEIPSLILPICKVLDNIQDIDINHVNTFIGQFIRREKEICSTEGFWKVWKEMYSYVFKLNYSPINKEYLLSHSLWLAYTDNWISLRRKDLWLYDKAAQEHGNNPIVLSSIAKMLTGIGRQWIHEGIKFISCIVSKYPDLNLREEEKETIIYLDRIMNKFVRENRVLLKLDNELRTRVIRILSFMVERNSTTAYMLRDQIV